MDKLIYYYRIVHLQVGDTYIVALSLLAFALEVVYAFVTRQKAGDILRAIIWAVTLSPVGYFLAKIIGHGEPNNPIAFALIPAAVCVGYGVALVWKMRPRATTLIAAAVVILIAAGQVSGFETSAFTTDALGREDDVIAIESHIDQAVQQYGDGFAVIAPFEVASRLAEYRSDLKIYVYEEWIGGQGAIDNIAYEPMILICPSYDAESGLVPVYEKMQGLMLTDKYSVFLVTP